MERKNKKNDTIRYYINYENLIFNLLNPL
jgi:hypothetical protein